MIERVSQFIIKNTKLLVFLTTILALGMGLGILKLESDYSARAWLDKDSKEIKTIKFI